MKLVIINMNKENWKLETVELTCNISFWEAETGRSLQVQDQRGPYIKF